MSGLLLIGLLLSADVPDAGSDVPLAVVVHKGDLVPADGTLLPYPLDVQTANRLQQSQDVPLLPIILTIVGVAALSFAGGIALGWELRR